MRPIMTHLLIVQALVLLLHFPTKTNSQNGPLLHICPPDSNYTIPSPFKTNLDRLLSTLVMSTSTSPALFSNTTLGPVYGLAQCRPDASVADCASCLNRSVSTISSLCPLRRSAATRFDLCLLRYSDHRFFSQLASDTPGIIVNGNDASNQSVHDRQLKSLMDKISSEAPKSVSRYAVGVINSTQFQLIYGMVQCTRDLSVNDCARCLDEEVGLFPTNGFGKVGAQVFRISCTARFESDPFFSLSVLPPPPPPPPPPLPSTTLPGNNSGTGSIVHSEKKCNTMTVILSVVIPLVVALNLLPLATVIYLWRLAIKKAHQRVGGLMDGEYCLTFDLGTLRDATDNFSDANKLGVGGFGPVYKGDLKDGQEIAVKRFFGTSAASGLVELKNEVALLAKLQHKNLVKLLGCCLEKEEKLLVYEYLPNTSLDRYLFDPIRCEHLDWASRFKIIEGTSRGLVYLHEDSRLKVIHRDLKASNILLDKDMNPKISDFGIAKLFGMDETQGSTSRIAGTYGYMAPEYAILGRYSNKSDVYSFGVVVLEIVTGSKNSGFQRDGNDVDLLTHIWQHWNEGTVLHLKDHRLGDDFQAEQVLRCINIGLLCVQEDPNERPNMASVGLMLNSYLPLPSPSKPAFVGGGSTMTVPSRDMVPDVQQNEQLIREPSNMTSVNDVSISELEGR